MKLLRATCDCGFVTRKARTGYHHDQWWFPLFSTNTGQLTDVQVNLPIADRDRIDRQQVELYCGTLGSNQDARREASAKMTALGDDIRSSFIHRETIVLQNQYASDDTSVFNPPFPSTWRCPDGGRASLVLDHVDVIAICKADCGHQYHGPIPKLLDAQAVAIVRIGFERSMNCVSPNFLVPCARAHAVLRQRLYLMSTATVRSAANCQTAMRSMRLYTAVLTMSG